ncbi:unnamed protein product [Dovyalis caffra]|uniref:SAM domain-containing protein n=1 Tax=Dovyalis caffra TaxID=77055 RepID=A0AAV1SD43_9ROSI|nr:unnamed protein product [Dovyalis caffra]
MDSSVDGFLHSLGLEKYLITFQAEEVDMTALVHMTDEDLKALGIPMVFFKMFFLAPLTDLWVERECCAYSLPHKRSSQK